MPALLRSAPQLLALKPHRVRAAFDELESLDRPRGIDALRLAAHQPSLLGSRPGALGPKLTMLHELTTPLEWESLASRGPSTLARLLTCSAATLARLREVPPNVDGKPRSVPALLLLSKRKYLERFGSLDE